MSRIIIEIETVSKPLEQAISSKKPVKNSPHTRLPGACTTADECFSGHCQNGLCCASGDCCSTAADCPEGLATASTCGDTANCQGTRNEATCQSNSCVAVAIADDTACAETVQSKTCAPYGPAFCNGSKAQATPQCSKSCTLDTDCLEGSHCDGTCQTDLADGLSCDEPSDCAGGHCQNGFCCASGDCCSAAEDCDGETYGSPATCDTPTTCQGTRGEPVCNGSSQCTEGSVDDDSACDGGTVADTCGLYPSQFCTGASDQAAPACADSCVTFEDCDNLADCETVDAGTGTCVPAAS